MRRGSRSEESARGGHRYGDEAGEAHGIVAFPAAAEALELEEGEEGSGLGDVDNTVEGGRCVHRQL